MLYILIMSLAASEMIDLFLHNSSQQVIAAQFSAYENSTDREWTLETDRFTNAGMLTWVVDPEQAEDISKIARVQFYAEYLKWNETVNDYDIGH